jgi:fibro-slime domain-containing protein
MDDIDIGEGGFGGEGTGTGDCTPKAIGLLRDFQSIYPEGFPLSGNTDILTQCPVYDDFEYPWPDPVDYLGHPEPGIAADELGPDRKPVIADEAHDYKTITSPETFHAWYRDDPQCNKTYEYELPMEVDPVSGNLVFESTAFFPLDGAGYGTSGAADHNFHFTFELHMTFVYRAGDVFNFEGDDDLFVYINDQLVIDLGGAHSPMAAAVNLDELGLVPGEEYPIDFFHAERAQYESNFHIETSLNFSNCEPIIVR